MEAKEEIVKNCLDIMKELEPVGVCAYDVKECLCLQLKKNYEDCEVELAIIQDGMELLGKKQLQTLAKIIHVPVDRIKLARDRILHVESKAGAGVLYRRYEPVYCAGCGCSKVQRPF